MRIGYTDSIMNLYPMSGFALPGKAADQADVLPAFFRPPERKGRNTNDEIAWREPAGFWNLRAESARVRHPKKKSA